MKLEKLILPILIAAVFFTLYLVYFSPKDEFGLFSEFDPSSNINRDIIVKLIPEKGFVLDKEAGGTIFYVEDRSGRQLKVVGPLSLPPGMDVTNSATLRGHIHIDYFHAVEVLTRN